MTIYSSLVLLNNILLFPVRGMPTRERALEPLLEIDMELPSSTAPVVRSNKLFLIKIMVVDTMFLLTSAANFFGVHRLY